MLRKTWTPFVPLVFVAVVMWLLGFRPDDGFAMFCGALVVITLGAILVSAEKRKW